MPFASPQMTWRRSHLREGRPVRPHVLRTRPAGPNEIAVEIAMPDGSIRLVRPRSLTPEDRELLAEAMSRSMVDVVDAQLAFDRIPCGARIGAASPLDYPHTRACEHGVSRAIDQLLTDNYWAKREPEVRARRQREAAEEATAQARIPIGAR